MDFNIFLNVFFVVLLVVSWNDGWVNGWNDCWLDDHSVLVFVLELVFNVGWDMFVFVFHWNDGWVDGWVDGSWNILFVLFFFTTRDDGPGPGIVDLCSALVPVWHVGWNVLVFVFMFVFVFNWDDGWEDCWSVFFVVRFFFVNCFFVVGWNNNWAWNEFPVAVV
jgi:hypothetical protein